MRILHIRKSLLSALVIVGVLCAQAEPVVLKAKPGSKVQIDGTSTVHDWTVEGKLVGGSVTVGEGFPVDASASVKPGKLEATVNAFIPITSLKSVKNGKPYSEKMDEIMHEKLGKPDHKMIFYTLDELTLTALPEAPGEPLVCTAQGHLVVAGVTNAVELPLEITPLDDGKVKFATRTSVKMTDYSIEPPAPKIALGMIKTGDEVQISVKWMTARVQPK